MPVANNVYFTKEHIERCRFDASAALAEQAVHCLELVAELVYGGLSFQFKGGNSLLVLMQAPRRFSIDVDIATDEPQQRIEGVLDRIVADCGVFVKWAHRPHKTKPWIKLASYYLFYRSHVASEEEAFIMLDAQLVRSPYATQRLPVACGELYKTVVQAEVPLTSSIIGDKLLTLGPNTLGIPFGKGKEAQRIKHVFDISLLLNAGPALGGIRESFVACIGHENALQKKTITAQQLLSDTLLFCRSVMDHDNAPQPADGFSPALAETVKGLPEFAGHLFTKSYTWKNLQTDMARVALCIAAVCSLEVDDAQFEEVLLTKGNDARACWTAVQNWLKAEK
jgi:hypothetical protein